MQESLSRELKPLEYTEMMRELDEAQEWTIAQLLGQLQIAQESVPNIGDSCD